MSGQNIPSVPTYDVDYYQVEGDIIVNFHRRPNSNPPRINGKDVEQLRHSTKAIWFRVEGETEVKTVEFIGPARITNERFELINPDVVNSDIPRVLKKSEVELEYDDDLEENVWGNEKYSKWQNLYTYKHDRAEPEYELVPLGQVTLLGEVRAETIDVPVKTYSLHKSRHSYNSTERDTQETLNSLVRYEELNEILVNPILIHNTPCVLSSDAAYRIIRSYILDNIDSSVARVTSNYDFCFTVHRIVKVKPRISRTEKLTARSRSYKPPRYIEKRITEQQVKLFEMTSKSHKYKGYPILPDFEGETLHEVYENFDRFLVELITEINKPVEYCPHCDGFGVISPIMYSATTKVDNKSVAQFG